MIDFPDWIPCGVGASPMDCISNMINSVKTDFSLLLRNIAIAMCAMGILVSHIAG